MENLPIDAIDLASRVFYSESEDKIYFGDPINGYFEVIGIQDLDSVLEQGSNTTRNAKFESGDNITSIEPGIVVVTDESSEEYTRLEKDKLILSKGLGVVSNIESSEEVGVTTHTLQPKSGIIAHIDDISPDIKFITNADDNSTLSTTKSSMIVTANISAITIVKLPELTEGLIVYLTNKGSADLNIISNDSGDDIWDEGTAKPGIDIVQGTTAKLVCDGVHYVLFK